MSDERPATPLAADVLGSRLALAREQAGLSQGQSARLMGLHRPTISEIEAGRRRVTADEATRFSEIYGVSLEWLLAKGATDPGRDRVELAARELAKLKEDDLDAVLGLLAALRKRSP